MLAMTRLSPGPTSTPKLQNAPRSVESGAVVRRLPSARTDEEILRGIREGQSWAGAALLDRYGSLVERIVRRIMGHDPELADLVQDAFTTILTSVGGVRDEKALKGWIISVSAHTAHHAIRRRKLTRLIFFWTKDDPPEPSCETDMGSREALRRVYAALSQLPADERVAFALRRIDEMPLEDVAAACDCSLATIKRRLVRAEQRFSAIARRDPVLKSWMDEGERWT